MDRHGIITQRAIPSDYSKESDSPIHVKSIGNQLEALLGIVAGLEERLQPVLSQIGVDQTAENRPNVASAYLATLEHAVYRLRELHSRLEV